MKYISSQAKDFRLIQPKSFSYEEILKFAIQGVDEDTFNIGVERASFQFIYESQKKQLLVKYFGGNQLKYSITMADIFRPLEHNALRLNELNIKIKELANKIRLSKKWKWDIAKLSEMIKEHNTYCLEFKELSKPIKKILKKHINSNRYERSISKL